MAGCPQIPPDSTSAAASHEFVQPKISICSDHSAPSFSRSRIFHNCTMQQKSAQIIPPPKKKNGRRENRVRGFSCRVFGFANPLKQPKESNWHFVSQPQKSPKPQLLNLDQNLNPLKFSQKSGSFYLLQKIKIFNLNLSGIPISAQGSPQRAFLTTSLSPACRWPAAAASGRYRRPSQAPPKLYPTNKKTLCHTNPIGY